MSYTQVPTSLLAGGGDVTKNTKKPIIGGIFSIISGVAFTAAIIAIVEAEWQDIPLVGLSMVVVYLLAGGILPILGGIFALQRKRWWVAFAGSIGAVIGIIFTGVPAIVLIAMSRDEFE